MTPTEQFFLRTLEDEVLFSQRPDDGVVDIVVDNRAVLPSSPNQVDINKLSYALTGRELDDMVIAVRARLSEADFADGVAEIPHFRQEDVVIAPELIIDSLIAELQGSQRGEAFAIVSDLGDGGYENPDFDISIPADGVIMVTKKAALARAA